VPFGTPVFLYEKFDFYAVFVFVFVTFVPGGYCSAHFFIESEGVFVFRVAAEIEFLNSRFTAEIADIGKNFSSDSLTPERFQEIERLDIEGISFLKD